MGIAGGADRESAVNRPEKKMYAARLQRPTPYVDKTVYMSWNAMCRLGLSGSSKVLELEDARHFALRSLDRILAEAWRSERRHAARDRLFGSGGAETATVPGMLDDYAFTAHSPASTPTRPPGISATSTSRSKIGDMMIGKFL